jgi:glycosidase
MSIVKTLAFALILSLSIRANAAERQHEFAYKPDGDAHGVSVAGEFNNWSNDANPMTRGPDGVWRTKLTLADGIYHYKFVVNGDQWKNDPAADKSLDVDDSHGGVNSGVIVGPDARKLPPPQPNRISEQGVVFDPRDVNDVDPIDDGRVRVRIRAQAGDVQNAAAGGAPMYRVGSEMGFDLFGAIVNRPADGKLRVELHDGSATVARDAQIPDGAEFKTPDWAKSAIWYQIFPERFRNGDESNDPVDHDFEHKVPWTGDWWKTQTGEAPGDENFYKGQGNVWKRRYGGDVQGLIQSLPYLRKLGVNAIYLNPIFEAESMHKYDTSDYRHVDDNFGFKGDIAALQGETDDPSTWQWTKSDKLFLDFVRQARAMGAKVICDGVFNHVGKSHPFFVDVLKNGKNSKYADWFEITDWNSNPIKYKSWDGDGNLPVFRKDAKLGLAKGPREHVLAIAKRWVAPDGDATKGIDGWRLDVPGDIPHPFWVDFRKVVKDAKPDGYITGEIWTWAQPWLTGDQFDGVMNYRWADAAQQFFVNQSKAITPTQFDQQLARIAFTYPYQAALVQQNLFDSHDTDRFASMFVNPDLPYDGANRIQDNGPNYKKDKPTPLMIQRMRQAIVAQMGFVGAPMIYYGDEAGMWSPDDPSNRQPMTWPGMKFDDPQVGFDEQQFAFYQRAIAIRRKLPELREGFFHGVLCDDAAGVYAFARDLGGRHAYVVLNRSSENRTVSVPVEPDQAKLFDWMDDAQAAVRESVADRPMVELKPDAAGIPVAGGKFTITLKPFASAVVAKP